MLSGLTAKDLLRHVVLAILTASLILATQVDNPRSARSAHFGHLKNNYFVLPFIEDIPNTPIAFLPVYDCAGQGHTHVALISAAVTAWNDTGQVKFFYTSGSTTPCDELGHPETEGRLAITHNETVEGSFHSHRTTPHDAFRANDVGLEGDVGMYPTRKNRIHIRPNPGQPEEEVAVLVHELGHAAGLPDLYVEGTACENGHKHNPDTTVMDCSIGPVPLQHDVDNLDALYKKDPTQVNDFVAADAFLEGTQATVTFTWTDRSFNEKFQYIAIDNNLDGVGEGFPLPAPRDAETIDWPGLALDTQYCFFIQPGNGYGDLTPRSLHTCISTALDTDGDGCPDSAELQTEPGSETSGGLRDPFNPWDYFNPTNDGLNRIDDIMAVNAQTGIDHPDPKYTYATDRTDLPGGDPWDLGEPNGQQRVEDVLSAIDQFAHDCGAGNKNLPNPSWWPPGKPKP